MKPRTALWLFLLTCCAFAWADTLPLQTPAASGLPGWAWGAILLACVAVATVMWLRKRNPAAAAKVSSDVTSAVNVVANTFESIAAKFHAHLEASNANTAAAIAKIPVAPPATLQPVSPALAPVNTAFNAPAPAVPAGSGADLPPQPVVPPAETAPAPTTGEHILRDFNAEMPKMADWLNGTTTNFGLPQTPPAHPEIPGAFQKYFTTMEDLWQKNPDWGVGVPSYELALQAAIKAVPGAVVNPPIIPTAEVLQKGLFYNGLSNDAYRIGYLKLPGNNGLIDYLDSLTPSFKAWFMKADYQTDSGANDPITGQPMPQPRPWG